MLSSYRPHNSGHDYYAKGIYQITLVVRKHNALLSYLNNDANHPMVSLTDTGMMVQQYWDNIPVHHAARGRKIKVHASVCMPDHFHGVIEVLEDMDVSLGRVVQGFKAACTSGWRKLMYQQPNMAAGGPVGGLAGGFGGSVGSGVGGWSGPLSQPNLAEMLHGMSHKQRAAFYTLRPSLEQPLWDDDYDDTICIDDRHRDAMIHYVEDNPRRAIIRAVMPRFFERRMHVVIDGINYASFGNLFLLRWPKKMQVYCHRRDPLTRQPYEQTEAYQKDCHNWISAVMQGSIVLVTPGISEGEKRIKNLCLEHGFPLIHLQKYPIGPRWKPEKSRFDACLRGSLLILAPWNISEMGAVDNVPAGTDYSQFHNLNTLTSFICHFDRGRIIKCPKSV